MKNKLLLIAVMIFWFSPIVSKSESYNFSSSNYEDAKKADSYIKFDMASTKVGIFTSHFTGYVKKFSISGNKKNNFISDAIVEFDVKELDTDIDSRNEKMWDQCLDASHNPKIQIKLSQKIEIGGPRKDIAGVINVRGEDHPLTLSVEVNSDMIADIKGQVSIKDLKIPDPSIAIASVRDTIDISAHFIIKENNQK
ncbi:MAG: YceI family protein [Bdellovibrionota bacterium]